MTCKDCYHYGVCVLKNEKVNFANNVKDLQVDRFKCFKDKSRIIELPCKVGDTIYVTDTEYGIAKCIVVEKYIEWLKELKKDAEEYYEDERASGISEEIDRITHYPTINVESVRHGTWIGTTRSAFKGLNELGDPTYNDVIVYRCSKCNRQTVIHENYCPCCGARMDGE